MNINWKNTIQITLIVISFIFLNGYTEISSDHFQYLLHSLAEADSNFAANDWFTRETAPLHGNFQRLLSFSLKLDVLSETLFTIYLLLVILIIHSTWNFFNRNFLFTFLTLLITLFSNFTVWGEYQLLYNTVLPSTIINYILTASILYFLCEDYRKSCILICIGFFIHPTGSLSITLTFFLLFLYSLKNSKAKRKILKYFTPTIMLSVIILIFTKIKFTDNDTNIANVINVWETFFFFRSPHHFVTYALKLSSSYFLILILFNFSLLVIKKHKISNYEKNILLINSTGIFLWLLSIFFTEIYLIPNVVKLFTFRSIPVVLFFSLIFHLKEIEKNGSENKHIILNFTYIMLLAVLSKSFTIASIAFVFITLRRRLFLKEYNHLIYLAFALTTILLKPNHLLRRNPYQLHIYEIINKIVPQGEIVLSPPDLQGFQLYSKRATFFNFKCYPLKTKDAIEWKTRAETLLGSNIDMYFRKNGLKELNKSYKNLSMEKVKSIAKKYKTNYILMRKDHALAFEFTNPLYKDSNWIIARIP